MSNVEAIKKALEEVGPLKVEFTPDCDDFNSIIAPINADHDGTYFTLIGAGDKQNDLGNLFTLAVNSMPELLTTLEYLQRENAAMREALNPFALVAEYDIGEDEADNDRFKPMSFENCRVKLLTVGDLRRARTALASAGEEHHADK